jgi:hypothetical protein
MASDRLMQKWVDRVVEAIGEQSRIIADYSLATGIDWERIFSQTGGLVDTNSIVTAIAENTSETARLARAVEDLVDLYAVTNGQTEELYRLRDGQR